MVNESDIDDNVFKSIYITVLSNIQKILAKGSCWIIDSVIEHNISKCNLLAGSSYINYQKNKTIKEIDWLIFEIFIIMNALNGPFSDT